MSEPKIVEAVKDGKLDEFVNLLLDDPDSINATSEKGETLLLLAIYRHNNLVVDALLENGYKENVYELAALGEMDQIKQSLEKDPSLLNSYAPDGFYLLGLACFFGHNELAEYLIEQGADINQAANNELKVAPIHAAVAIGDLPLTTKLLDKGADVNKTQQRNITALHAAAMGGHIEMVELLLGKGADKSQEMEGGRTAAALAKEQGFDDLAEML